MKTVTFGEIMLRLSPDGYNKILQCDKIRMLFGGAESNVAVNLSLLNEETEFVSKLPDNDLGEKALAFLNSYKVGTKNIIRI